MSWRRGSNRGLFHHLDVFGHTLEVVRGVERELEERRVGAEVREERVDALRLVGLLHDIAKPLTRGEYEGKVMFVAHDTLGGPARLPHLPETRRGRRDDGSRNQPYHAAPEDRFHGQRALGLPAAAAGIGRRTFRGGAGGPLLGRPARRPGAASEARSPRPSPGALC